VTDHCDLCDLPADPPVTDPEVEGVFCCRGCLEVTRSLGDVESPEEVEERLGGDDTPVPDDAEEAFVRVDGMHCATCETYVESALAGTEGVFTAEASYPSEAAKVAYDPDAVADPASLSVAGYGVYDFDDDVPTDDGTVGRLLVGGFFGMLIMMWYVLFLYPTYYGFGPAFDIIDLGSAAGQYVLWNVLALTTVVLGYTGRPILRGALVSLRAGQPNMDLLVALAATTAYLYSAIALTLGHVELYFDVSVVIVVAVTLGGYYERRTVRRAADELGDMAAARVEEARRRTGRGTEVVPVEELRPGDEVVVPAGDRLPTDGTVTEGTAAVDRSLVTGESVPERVGPGDDVVGGAVVEDGRLVVAVGDAAESTLDRLVDTLWDVKSTRPGAQRLADRLAAVFVPTVVVVATVALGWRLLAGADPVAALLTALTVLVVSCPCALGLATPLAVASGVRRALDRGIVVANGAVFERATGVDVVALDKTGTLTTGEMRVVDVVGEEAGVDRAAAVEASADHPVARAVVQFAPDAPDAVTDFETFPGRGVGGVVDGRRVLVGRPALFADRDVAVPDELAERASEARDAGRIPTFVGWDGAVRTVLVVGDEPRPEWEATVAALGDIADRVVVVTGDARSAAAPFAAHPAIDEVFADVPPDAKTEVVQRLRAEGTTVMVGDGSNDAPALATADLGIALATGTELAVDAADAVVLDGFATVPTVFELTRSVKRRIRENLGWAFLYNAVAIPAAALGFLNPLVAAVAMAASSLLVVTNSSRSLGVDDAATAARTEPLQEEPAATPGAEAAADSVASATAPPTREP
jgi:Cu2+-exporting ATPase